MVVRLHVSCYAELMGTDTQDARKVLKALGISAVSACIAESVTLPLDTAKVRGTPLAEPLETHK